MNKEVKERFNKNKENMSFYDQDGTQQKKKKFTKRPPRAQKIRPVTYTLTEETGDVRSFFNVLDKMCNSCHIVESFMSNTLFDYTEEEVAVFSPDDYFGLIAAHVINTSMPRLMEKKFIHSALSVSANKIYVRTEGNVAFAFELKYQVVEKKAEITGCTGSVTLFAKNDKLVEDLENNGFAKVEK